MEPRPRGPGPIVAAVWSALLLACGGSDAGALEDDTGGDATSVGDGDVASTDSADVDDGETGDASADAEVDATATRHVTSVVTPTGGGGTLRSKNYRMSLSIGQPQPMGTRSENLRLRVGPAAARQP